MDSLGIQPAALGAQLIVIFIIYFLLKKFIFTPVVNLLEGRAKKISTSLKTAEKIEKQQQDLEIQTDKKIKEAQKKAQKIISQAKLDAQKETQKVLTQAKLDAKEIRNKALTDAQKEIKKQEQQLRKDAAQQAAQLAQLALKKVLANSDKKLINQFQANKLKNLKLA